jgi:hypothetical protein
MVREVEESLRSLRRNRIDLYQIHWVADDDALERVLAPGGAVCGLRRARDEGKISHIGITGHSREVLMRAVERCEDFATVQVPFNIVENECMGDLLPLCQERNVGVIAMKPIGGGNFTNAALALKWCLNQPIGVAIPGMSLAREVEENVAVAGDLTLSSEESAEVERMKSDLDERTCRRCRYCEPCPNGVTIFTLMIGRSFANRVGVDRVASPRFREAVASVESCIECGTCIERCPYGLPVPELVRDAAAWCRTVPGFDEG